MVLGSDNETSGNSNSGNPIGDDSWFSGDRQIIIGNEDWLLVVNRDAISGDVDDLLNGGLGNIVDGDTDNDQLIAGVDSLSDQIAQDFLGLLSGSLNFDQPMFTQGTGSNDSNALNSIGNSNEVLASLTGT